MPGTALRGSDILLHLILTTTYVVGTIINLILQVKKQAQFHEGGGEAGLPGLANKIQDAQSHLNFR